MVVNNIKPLRVKIVFIFVMIVIMFTVIVSVSYKWPRLYVFIRNSEELSKIFKACESINRGDSISSIHDKMDGFNISEFTDNQKARHIIYYTPTYPADLCRVYINENGQTAEKVVFDVD